MPGSKWSFVITNLKGEKLGQVKDAYERKYTANLSKPSTASFQVRQDNAVVPYLFDEAEDYLLQVWKGATLKMWGPIISANLAMTEGAPPSIAVTAADPSWRLGYRYYWGTGAGFVQGSTDKLIAARELIGKQNQRAVGGSTGISGTTDTCGSSGTYAIQTGKSALTGIQELSQGLDGFDWYIEPLPAAVPVTGTWASPYMPYIGSFRGAATVGSTKAVRFEYGAGSRNVRSINFLRDQSTRANVAINVSEEGLETTALNTSPIISYAVPGLNYARYGVYDGMAELSGVNNIALRQKYTEEAAAVRQNPRRVLGMTADIDDGTGRVPVFGVNYGVGDLVEARAVLNDDVVVFSGDVRVYAVEVALNSAGTGIVTPILVEES